MTAHPKQQRHDRFVADIEWPNGWQDDAKALVKAYCGVDERLRIMVGDPATSKDGSVIEGFVYLEGTVPTVIHDRSGRPDVYPWKLVVGPILRVYALRPHRKPALFAHAEWPPRPGSEPGRPT